MPRHEFSLRLYSYLSTRKHARKQDAALPFSVPGALPADRFKLQRTNLQALVAVKRGSGRVELCSRPSGLKSHRHNRPCSPTLASFLSGTDDE
jgi:hypothetical protein